jgi:hypothetical protein
MTDRHQGQSRNVGRLADAVAWKNISGETIPAYGVVQFRSNYDSGLGFSQAEKPDGTIGLFFVNGPVTVANLAKGSSTLWNRPQTVLLEGNPVVGDEVGPSADSWAMSDQGRGYRVLLQPTDGVGVVDRGVASLRIEVGFVRRCMGRGWYEIDRSRFWNGNPRELSDWTSDRASSSASFTYGEGCSPTDLSASGASSSSSSNGCDDCGDLSIVNCDFLDESPSDDGGSVPMDRGTPEVEDIVYMHTCRQLILRRGGMVKMVYRPEAEDTALSFQSGSGSEPPDPYYGKKFDMIDGEFPLRKLIFQDYTTCIDAITNECRVVLVETRSFLTEGFFCPPTNGSEDCLAPGSTSVSAEA